jgi:hypothetical protein
MTNHAAVAKAVFQSQFPNSAITADTLNGTLTIEVRDAAGALTAVSSRPVTETPADREAFEGELFATAKRLRQEVIESQGLTVRDVPVAPRPTPDTAGAL